MDAWIELPTIEDRLAFRADRFIPLAEKREQARQATALELILEVGDAAMKSVAEKLKSGTLPEPPLDPDAPACEIEM